MKHFKPFLDLTEEQNRLLKEYILYRRTLKDYKQKLVHFRFRDAALFAQQAKENSAPGKPLKQLELFLAIGEGDYIAARRMEPPRSLRLLSFFKYFCAPTTREDLELVEGDLRKLHREMVKRGSPATLIKVVFAWRVIKEVAAIFGHGLLQFTGWYRRVRKNLGIK